MKRIKQLYENIVPKNSDEEFICKIISKNKKTNKKYTFSIAVAITMVLTLTLSVGAVNNWDYPSIFNRFFNNNEKIIKSLETPPEYEVLQNTFENLDFKLTSLFADDGVIYLVVEITSDYDLFEDGENIFYSSDYKKSPYHLKRSDDMNFGNFSSKHQSIFIDKKNIKMMFGFYSDDLTEMNGKEFIFNLDGFNANKHLDNQFLDIFSIQGIVELKFTVSESSENNKIHIYPDIFIEKSDIFIKEIFITPYLVKINYEYPSILNEDEEYIEKMDIDVKFKTKDKKTKDLSPLGGTGIGNDGVTTQVSKTYILEDFIEVNQISSVIIDGVKFKI